MIHVSDIRDPKELPPEWLVGLPERVGKKFRWLAISDKFSNWIDGMTIGPIATLSGLAVVVDFLLLAPTVGVVRLMIHRARTPGW